MTYKSALQVVARCYLSKLGDESRLDLLVIKPRQFCDFCEKENVHLNDLIVMVRRNYAWEITHQIFFDGEFIFFRNFEPMVGHLNFQRAGT